jgi:hypothetical protein
MRLDTFRAILEQTVNPGETVAIDSGQFEATQDARVIGCGVCCPYAPDGSFVAIQVGHGENWNTLRVAHGTKDFKLQIPAIAGQNDIIRAVMRNEGKFKKRMFAWVEYTMGAKSAEQPNNLQ